MRGVVSWSIGCYEPECARAFYGTAQSEAMTAGWRISGRDGLWRCPEHADEKRAMVGPPGRMVECHTLQEALAAFSEDPMRAQAPDPEPRVASFVGLLTECAVCNLAQRHVCVEQALKCGWQAGVDFRWRCREHVQVQDWHSRFMSLAQHVSTWSKDPSTKVGAVIVGERCVVLGLGYNGFPRGVEDSAERLADKPTKYKLVVHAEANAILNASASVRGATLYATKSPCSECCKLIVQSGIEEVRSPKPSGDQPWAEDAKFSKIILQEGSVGWVMA
jgi:dCMP deaminase